MSDATASPSRAAPRIRVSRSAIVMALYLVFLMLPLYWLLNMSLKTNAEILGDFTLFPRNLTFQNYVTIFTDSDQL